MRHGYYLFIYLFIYLFSLFVIFFVFFIANSLNSRLGVVVVTQADAFAVMATHQVLSSAMGSIDDSGWPVHSLTLFL